MRSPPASAKPSSGSLKSSAREMYLSSVRLTTLTLRSVRSLHARSRSWLPSRNVRVALRSHGSGDVPWRTAAGLACPPTGACAGTGLGRSAIPGAAVGPGARQLAIPGAAMSTGCAAGPSFDAAASRALLELVERDAASLWWIGGHRPRPLAFDDQAMTEGVRLLSSLRQDNRRRASWLLDITSDLAIPCVAAVSVDDDGRGLACGLAAR